MIIMKNSRKVLRTGAALAAHHPPDMAPKTKFFFDLVRFRNSDNTGVVIVQCFMILSACLVVAGLLYVVIVMILIIFHHFLWDRDPKAVPSYVKQALQFDSEESEDETPSSSVGGAGGGEAAGGGNNDPENSTQGATARRKRKDDNVIEIVDESDYDKSDNLNSRKIRALEKFMNKDMDVGVVK